MSDYYHNRVKVVNQPSPSLNADHRPDPILLYGPEKDIETAMESSSLHTEQHFSELPLKASNAKRWRSSRKTPQSSTDLSDMISHRQSSISDGDDDMPGLVFNIPAGSRSTSIDSLSSYSQNSYYTSDPFTSTEDQKAPKVKRRISTAPTTLDTKQDTSHEEDFHLPPLARKLSQTTSRRYLPQNQAILQTDVQGKIIAFNETAVSLFGAKTTLLKMHALDLLEKAFRTKYFANLLDKFAHTRLERDSSKSVNVEKPSTTILLCGKVVPIITKDRTESVASLWLKEKHDGISEIIYVWIFEELYESMINVHINTNGVIERVDGDVEDLYGYTDSQLFGKSIETLIHGFGKMRLASDSGFYDLIPDEPDSRQELFVKSDCRRLDVDKINCLKFFGSQSATSTSFPVMTKVQESYYNPDLHNVKIISVPTIAGPITIRMDGTIQSSNAMFTKYLFGYELNTLLGENIARLLPQFSVLLIGLQTQQLLRMGYKLSHPVCYATFQKYNSSSASYFDHSSTCEGYFLATHRDSTMLNVQMQIKLAAENELVLWIEFDRSRRAQSLPIVEPEHTKGHVGFEQPYDIDPTPKQIKRPKPLGNVSSFGSAVNKVVQAQDPVDMSYNLSPKPAVVREVQTLRIDVNQFLPRRISYAAVVAPHVSGSNIPKYSAQTLKTCIDDYITLDSFGQGAYGVVKLAQHKTKKDQQRVVIKYVVKSRILVDAWTRDRVLGMLPLEIHILHTMRRIPHPNICQILDYFEDDDHYYIVMSLHGDGMDLFDYIELNRDISQNQVRAIFRQVAEAVQHLHHNKIVHRDIKDENVIIDGNDQVQLIDFGSAAYVKPDRMFETFSGTLDYAAPEILSGSRYAGPPQDIWSLGILLYTLVFKENPFYNIEQAMSREPPKLLQIAAGWQGAADLMQHMLNRSIDDRPTIDQVLAHPWLLQV
ncbi:hypothetical protein K450DRAFT_272041 [Umbelopsis ramanniana AG]|uniref:non-specific serine/threonine protein kinase n=1 Tax=Umbelopsis ramanniana AG TaxID=1314678 RepID=A0AAD5HE72_UMBRA|nr:uncharacterized protein K450DRAFT_272041 [Umbelopsis ramanniana AG]KAI8579256.1 hypothetical protein K450DRAFT_272041 [Umbelopsis ramanniana AG]